MRNFGMVAAGLCIGLLAATAAHAGSPLKGVDVKLGRSPGGGCSARTTDANGKADFGVWPKGNYTISVAPGTVQKTLHVTVSGATGGVQVREIDAATAARALPVVFSVDGTAPIRIIVESAALPLEAARIKSHSNSTNN